MGQSVTIQVMGNKHGGVIAGELLAQLAADPEYQAVRTARDRELVELAEQRRREQQPLLEDLAAAGVTVGRVACLLEVPEPDKRIYPALLDHISKPYSPWLLKWIGRAFGRKTARAIVWDTLIELINTHALEVSAAEGVIAAISDMACPGDVHTLVDLLSGRSLGSNRIYLVGNLTRWKRPEARTALLRLQSDPDLAKEITARLSLRRG